jgi:UDP-N-acetylmuramate: L-alanyl-gamma-D-glutamyl-meso-diaminopimelate ligase
MRSIIMAWCRTFFLVSRGRYGEIPLMTKHVHILGICGTAMAAIAKLAKDSGFIVTGSDAGVYPPMSDFLRAEGIAAFEGYDAAHLDPVPDLVVIGNAMSRGNAEVESVLNQGLSYCSGPEFIGRYILPGRHAVVVAGTHGKTTTASLMAHVLDVAGQMPGFMIGGIPENFGAGSRLGIGPYFVLEGDEYDTAFFDKRSKFLHYRARTLILNNLEYDHADIFPDIEAIKHQFALLLRTVPAAGTIVINAEDANLAEVLARGCWTPVLRFARHGQGVEADWFWEPVAEDGSRFRLWYGESPFGEFGWDMIGRHHVANACAVAAAAEALGLDARVIRQGIESFGGVRRRMTLVGECRGIRVYDDFAHHPTAIAGVVESLKAKIGAKERLWVIVEPRSNTMRSRVHQQRLPAAFAGADRVIFVPPSKRDLKPDQVLDVQAVCRAIGPHAQVLPDVPAIVNEVAAAARAGDHVLILSNGGFDGIHQRLLEAL